MSGGLRHGDCCDCPACTEVRVELAAAPTTDGAIENAEDTAEFAEMEQAWRDFQCQD